VDPAACRQHLAQLIAEQVTALSELAVLLEREHTHLLDNDVAALEAAIRERQQCVVRLVRVDEEYRTLCRGLNHSTDPEGMQRLLRWCDPNGELAVAWSQCTASASRCRALNDRNGALVGARLKHVQARLELLIKGRRDPVTYGPHGSYAVGPVGRVVTAEA